MEQRSLSELLTLYQLEPSLRDIFVEGTFDRRLLSWFLYDRDSQRTHIYLIDEIAVPDAILGAHRLRSGARSKVIALAKEMDAALPSVSRQVTCIVDSNCEGALGISYECSRLFHTDYADLDCYILTEDNVAKFLALVLGVDAQDQGEPLGAYFDILREPFLLRMAGISLGIDVARVDITKSCRIEGGSIGLDRGDLTGRMLNKSGAATMLRELRQRVEELRVRLDGDPRRYISGHDFMDVFAWRWASEMRRRGLRDHSVLPYVLLNGVDRTTLRDEVLFRTIQARLGP